MSPRNTVARVLERLVAVLSVVILLMSLVSIASILVIQHEVRQTASTITPLIETSTALRIEVTEAQTNYRAYLTTEDDEFLERYRDSKRAFEEDRDDFLTATRRGAIERSSVDEFLDAGERWFDLADRAIEDPSGDPERVFARTSASFDRVTEQHDDLVVEIGEARQERRDRYGMAMSGAIALMGLATLLALVVTVHQGRRALSRLARPLQALQRVVARHKSGVMESRADVTQGADEVVALASAFNSLAEANASMQVEREYRLTLYRVTGDVPAILAREDGWGAACAVLGRGLGAHAVSVYRLESTDTAVLMGGWDATREEFPQALGTLSIPGLAGMLADLPILRASNPREIEETFPAALREVARERSIQTWVLHPMCFGDDAVGALSVATLEPRVWDRAEIQAMERVAEYAAHSLVEQRYVTSLEELDQQKTDFMSTTSHELRTPLTSIAGYLELLEDGDYGQLTGPQAHALEVVARNVSRLRSLIDDLLLLNRLDSGAASTERRVYDVRRSLRLVAEQLAPVAAAADVELSLEQPEEPVLVCADSAQIERAVGNVVSNAVKFTPVGGRVRLEATTTAEEVRLACADTGMGIPAADQERLFTRFFRATNAQEGEVPGTGLGLVIVRTIAEGHGGRVEVDSVEGEGTTVAITLPTVSSLDTAARVD